jgi:hypothetical protein
MYYADIRTDFHKAGMAWRADTRALIFYIAPVVN